MKTRSKKKQPEPQLITPPEQRWTVHTHADQVTHELHHDGKPLPGGKVTASYEHVRAKLVQLATLYNKHDTLPLPRTQCAADATDPHGYVARHANKNQTVATDEN